MKVCLFFCSVVLLTGCSGQGKAPKAPDFGDYDSAESEAERSSSLQRHEPRPDVSAFMLDDAELRIPLVRVGLLQFMKHECPVVTFELPELADYVEIIRCRSDAVIRGTFDSITDLDLGVSTSQEKTDIMQSNDFWLAAEESAQCLLIVSNYTDKENFLDCAAQTGDYRYLMRACVDEERLTEQEELGSTRNCTKQVSISPALEDYENKRSDEERANIAEALRQRQQIDYLGRKIYSKTVEYNNALLECQEVEMEREAMVKRSQAFNSILGFGISLGAQLIAPDLTGGSQINSFKDAWEAKDQIAENGNSIGNTLNLLFTSAADFHKSCTKAERYKSEGEILVEELKTRHQLYAIAMDKAGGIDIDAIVDGTPVESSSDSSDDTAADTPDDSSDTQSNPDEQG